MTSILEREIREQGAVVRRRLDDGWSEARQAAALISRADVKQLVVAARGSSDNAARYAQYLLGGEARLLVSLAAPSLYGRPEEAPSLEASAALGISQSGASPDVVGVLQAARAQGRPAIALTNTPGSPLAHAADVVVPLLAGEERSVAATKTFTATLVALLQITEALVPDADRREHLAGLPGQLDRVIDEQLDGRSCFDPLADAGWITVLGRGTSYGAAHETALKLRELSAIPAEGLSPPDILHGPIAALGTGAAVWAIAASASETRELTPVWRELLARGVTGVAVAGGRSTLSRAAIAVRLPHNAPAWAVAPLATAVAQIAGLRLAELAGTDVDTPHGLAKVTRTR